LSSIQIPHNYAPRPYQLPALRAFDAGKKRIVAVWHRRAGKEKTFINSLREAAPFSVLGRTSTSSRLTGRRGKFFGMGETVTGFRSWRTFLNRSSQAQ
jgi:hypothetical protein